MGKEFEIEVKERKRFNFGKNWSSFLSTIDKERILHAESSLKEMLEVENLEGKKVIDIGSGSGLFSLSFKKMGAKVFSFGFDPNSVASMMKLKGAFYPNDTDWEIKEGSILEKAFLQTFIKRAEN